MAKAAMKVKTDDAWLWVQSNVDKDKWMTVRIPDGDVCCPRINRMSKNTDGSYTFVVYRNQKYIGSTRGNTEAALLEAQKLARSGKIAPETVAKADKIKKYLDAAGNRPGDADAFKRFTKAEQALIAETYPWAMPKRSELASKGIKVATTRSDLMTKGEAKADALKDVLPMDAKIQRLRDGNPKKEGSAPYPRWQLMFGYADSGKSVGEFVKGGGNTTTLRNACLQGWVKVSGYKP